MRTWVHINDDSPLHSHEMELIQDFKYSLFQQIEV